MKTLESAMIQFLIDHPFAQSIVYKMMKAAATTGTDAKMVEWHRSLNKNLPG